LAQPQQDSEQTRLSQPLTATGGANTASAADARAIAEVQTEILAEQAALAQTRQREETERSLTLQFASRSEAERAAEAAIVERIEQHWEAGADHVCIQTIHPDRAETEKLLASLARLNC